VINPVSDSSTSVTFANFQFDGNTSPAQNYNPDNYRIKAESQAVNGSTACAKAPGISPCVPTTDFAGDPMSVPAIGIFAAPGSSNASVPNAPTGLQAFVN